MHLDLPDWGGGSGFFFTRTLINFLLKHCHDMEGGKGDFRFGHTIQFARINVAPCPRLAGSHWVRVMLNKIQLSTIAT